MYVFDDVNLTLVFRKRKTSRTVCQSPLACVIVDRESDELHKRRARTSLRLVFVIRPWRSPHPSQVYLSKCGNVRTEHCQEK